MLCLGMTYMVTTAMVIRDYYDYIIFTAMIIITITITINMEDLLLSGHFGSKFYDIERCRTNSLRKGSYAEIRYMSETHAPASRHNCSTRILTHVHTCNLQIGVQWKGESLETMDGLPLPANGTLLLHGAGSLHKDKIDFKV